MMSKIWQRRLLALFLAFAGLTLWPKVTLIDAALQTPLSEITVTGRVKVNDKIVSSGYAIRSGSTVTTAKGSSAVVSLGKLGRVEVLPQSTVDLSFNDTGMTMQSRNGNLQTTQFATFTASVVTDDGEVVADSSQENKFTVNTLCGNTVVSTQSGLVELRASGEVKRIPAGSQESIGKIKPGRCKQK
jgi:hypothetical protein